MNDWVSIIETKGKQNTVLEYKISAKTTPGDRKNEHEINNEL